jgi:hypothetical protein
MVVITVFAIDPVSVAEIVVRAVLIPVASSVSADVARKVSRVVFAIVPLSVLAIVSNTVLVRSPSGGTAV